MLLGKLLSPSSCDTYNRGQHKGIEQLGQRKWMTKWNDGNGRWQVSCKHSVPPLKHAVPSVRKAQRCESPYDKKQHFLRWRKKESGLGLPTSESSREHFEWATPYAKCFVCISIFNFHSKLMRWSYSDHIYKNENWNWEFK